MQVGILTYYGVHNHGAVLQANALKSVLQKLGHDVSFLSFERSYEYISAEQTKKYKIGLNSIPYYFKFMKEKGIGNILYNVQKNRILNVFRSSQFKFIPYDQFDGDVTIVGSDEVFSLEIGYNPFMYGYGLKSRNVISYSGSFGPSTIEEISSKEKKEPIRDGLNQFKAISVRDQNSQNIVKALCGHDVPLTCDPVLLYGYDKEQREYVPHAPKYIAIYAYDHRMNDPEEVYAIKEYAKKHNLKVYSIAYYHQWCDKNINVDPIQLLGWMKNAELVITDTFHGSVISIICNSPLVVKTRKSNENKLSYLLDEYGLSSQKLKNFSDLEDIAREPINFDAVNRKVIEKRNESLSYLKNALESCK